MKIQNGYMVREIRGQSFAVPTGSPMDSDTIIKLNPTAAFIWKRMQKDCNQQELVDSITSEFYVDRDTASRDIRNFVASLRENNLLE